MTTDPTIDRLIIDSAYPDSPLFEPDPDGDMEKFRDADGEILTEIREPVKALRFIRDPARTDDLTDLELELGITPAANLSEAKRRELLQPVRYPKATTGNDTDLQSLLDNAGFDLTVYNNSPDGPAIDPALILDQSFQMQAQGGTNFYAGNDAAYAGRIGGYLLVNGAVFDQTRDFFGAGTVWAGNANAVAGYFESLRQTPVVYDIPTDSDDWPFVFFVGGDATFNPDGSIADIDQGFVPSEEKKRLDDIILKFKPLFTWCGVIVTFT